MNKRVNIVLIGLLVFITSCNLPGGTPLPPPSNANTETSIPIPGASPTETITPTITLTPTITPTSTPTVPTVTVSQDTNCRTGPGVQFDLVSALLIGQSAEIVGKNTAANYWIIKTPGGSGTCWLWGQYATVSGDIAGLPEIASPPTPTPAPPAAVSNLTAVKICIPLVFPNYQYGGNITWEDKSSNEEGFNIYFNGGLLGTVGPDVTAYPIPVIVFPAGVPMTLGVEAFNSGGKSATKNVVVTCP